MITCLSLRKSSKYGWVWASVLLAMLAANRGMEGAEVTDKIFTGPVRLILPPVIYAVEGVEANIYFDNIVLVVNPENYIFDVTCDVGSQYDERWTFVPKAEEIGDHAMTIEVRDRANTVIARARSLVKVMPSERKHPGGVTLLAMGDSHLQRDYYLQRVLDLSRGGDTIELTLVGSRGRGNQSPSDELRHEGYNGWTAAAFATLKGPMARSGLHRRPETGSPLIYTDDTGESRLDMERYCEEFNHGQSIDFVLIQVGGNDIWRANDDNIDECVDKVFKHYDVLIDAIHAYSKQTRIGIVVVDPPSRSQHGFRNYRGTRKQTRWQYRRNQHRMVERQIGAYGGREHENIYLVPVAFMMDCEHGFPIRSYPRNTVMLPEEERVYDGVHRSPEGYAQYGDVIYTWLVFSQSQMDN